MAADNCLLHITVKRVFKNFLPILGVEEKPVGNGKKRYAVWIAEGWYF